MIFSPPLTHATETDHFFFAIRRARKQAEDAAGQSFENYLDRLCATPTLPPPSELASFPHPENVDPPDAPAGLTSARDWPPTDEKTGKPLYFVG